MKPILTGNDVFSLILMTVFFCMWNAMSMFWGRGGFDGFDILLFSIFYITYLVTAIIFRRSKRGGGSNA